MSKAYVYCVVFILIRISISYLSFAISLSKLKKKIEDNSKTHRSKYM